jgi:hypothetical protein
MYLRALVGATAAVLTLSVPAFHARAQTAKPIVLTPFVVQGTFVGEEAPDTAMDISGIACLAPAGGKRVCLVVNDENKNAQFVTLDGQNAVVGDSVTLIGDAPDKATLGKAPEIKCPKGEGDFKEFDGEGVAFSAPYFYVVGSYGCSRKKGKFRLSSFILSRIHVDAAGRPSAEANASAAAAALLNTYRVSDILQRLGKTSESIGKDLETDSGLNIEGLAVDGDRIWFGLRAPLDEQNSAVLVEASVADLFNKGNEPSALQPKKVTALPLGKLGIRDLALMPDKTSLLVLAGATHGTEVPFRLFTFDLAKGTLTDLGVLPPVIETVKNKPVTGKAEAITVLEADAEKIIATVLFDSLPNGAPRMATIPLK